MKITYRKLAPSESDIYRTTRLKCLKEFPDSFGSDYEEEKKKEKLLFSEYIELGDTENFVIGAFNDSDCIGICGFLREKKKRTKHRGHIIQVYVSKTHQGSGIGKKLLEQTVTKAFNEVGVEQITLGVVAGNDGAKTMYENLGFKEYGRLNGHTKTEDGYLDEILMIKYKNNH